MSSQKDQARREGILQANARRDLYKPGCFVMMLPALGLLALGLLGVLGGWAMWIALPILGGIIVLGTMIWFINKREK